MKVLIVGSGARERTIVRARSRDENVTGIECARNAGIAGDVTALPLDVTDTEAVLRSHSSAVSIWLSSVLRRRWSRVQLTLSRAAGIACFGPSAQAAQLEGSKAFAKEVMAGIGVPTTMALVCTDRDQIDGALDTFTRPDPVRREGRWFGRRQGCSGHRRSCCHSRPRTARALPAGVRGDGGFLDGPEVSIFAITDWNMRCCRCSPRRISSVPTTMTPARTLAAWAVLAAVVGADRRGRRCDGAGVATDDRPRWPPRNSVCRIAVRRTGDDIAWHSRRWFNARFGDRNPGGARLRSELGGLMMAAATGHLEPTPLGLVERCRRHRR